MRADFAYPTDGVLTAQPPKHPDMIPRLDDGARWVLPAGGRHPTRSVPDPGIPQRITESYVGDAYFRVHSPSGTPTYCRGMALNTPTPVGKPVLLLGVPGIDHDVLPWVVGTVLRRTDHTEVVVRTLWAPDDAIEAVGRVYRGEHWVRIIDTPPAEYLPVKGDDDERLALKREARGAWLRWASTWVALVSEGAERRWHDALVRIAENANYTPVPLEWERIEVVNAVVPTTMPVPESAVENLEGAPGTAVVEPRALAQVRVRMPVQFVATDPSEHETEPDVLTDRLRRWNRHANFVSTSPETPHLNIV